MTIYEKMCSDKVFAASVMSAVWNITDYEDDDYDPSIMAMLDSDCDDWSLPNQSKSIQEETAALRVQLYEQENEPLTLEELREMELQQWVWIETKMPFDCKEKVSAYYSKHYDYTHDTAFCCGYPGITFSFDYGDYGKTWLAYRRFTSRL